MKNYITIGLIAILTSCSPTQQQKSAIIDKKLISLPPLFEVTSIEIGLPMVEEGYEYREKAILLKSVPPLKSKRIKNLRAGDVLRYVTTLQGNDVFYNSNTEGVVINEKTGRAGYYTQMGNIYLASSERQIEYEHTTIRREVESGFKQQFIYNGKSGSTIKFTYREFNGDLARPAFTQDLQYDLSDSNMIGFKDLRIEILKANNIEIQYKVHSKFK